ncbi:putative lipid-binding protein AIR1 [Brachypodium distachyon]|uniref:Proline-rich protein n=1 Tax=Brachypodium distachyon TaxID=15368 RepID=C3SAB3_BRADI|nr:putative lipid-binding protein AIR1 [Brachypodium distachyon]ACF22747.1 proline-rich protein [Brachypodium distachyon]KQK24119.1 hypothetical protein BRADI_1g78240v3 [Brachypodium distachyon]|eukprot:XP_003559026.1 putative lipid-binding protein AIR1 [Brachypodium distachyon]
MAATKKTFSAATLLVLVIASTFIASSNACSSCHHTTPSPPPPAAPAADCPPPPYSPSPSGYCPTDTLKLGVCANVLGLVKVELGHPPSGECCSLLGGLADLEAAVCLCTALKANVLGIVLNIPVKLSLLLNYCGKTAPQGFICA